MIRLHVSGLDTDAILLRLHPLLAQVRLGGVIIGLIRVGHAEDLRHRLGWERPFGEASNVQSASRILRFASEGSCGL